MTQQFQASGGVVADTPGERGATTSVSASIKGEAARRPESALYSSGTNAGNIDRLAEIVASKSGALPARLFTFPLAGFSRPASQITATHGETRCVLVESVELDEIKTKWRRYATDRLKPEQHRGWSHPTALRLLTFPGGFSLRSPLQQASGSPRRGVRTPAPVLTGPVHFST